MISVYAYNSSSAALAILLFLIVVLLCPRIQVHIVARSAIIVTGGWISLVLLLSRGLFLLQSLLCHYLERHVFKHLIDIKSGLCACLIELHAMLSCELLSFSCLHLLIGQVGLVCYQNAHNVNICVLIDLLKPIANVVESLSLGRIIDEYDTLCAFVVVGGDRLEAFLTSSVPKLHFDSLVMNL